MACFKAASTPPLLLLLPVTNCAEPNWLPVAEVVVPGLPVVSLDWPTPHTLDVVCPAAAVVGRLGRDVCCCCCCCCIRCCRHAAASAVRPSKTALGDEDTCSLPSSRMIVTTAAVGAHSFEAAAGTAVAAANPAAVLAAGCCRSQTASPAPPPAAALSPAGVPVIANALSSWTLCRQGPKLAQEGCGVEV